jgi:hypothetical protein
MKYDRIGYIAAIMMGKPTIEDACSAVERVSPQFRAGPTVYSLVGVSASDDRQSGSGATYVFDFLFAHFGLEVDL